MLYNEIRAQCDKSIDKSTILCLDKTFNLTKRHKVTITCFRHKNLNRLGKEENVLMLGPIYIHQDSDYETFNMFLSHVRGKLNKVDISGVEVHDNALIGINTVQL